VCVCVQYAKYLEQKNSLDGVRNVYRRACDIHLPKKPYINLAWAAFEERQGNDKCCRFISCTEGRVCECEFI
jgi:pre-mRNA-processing factor 39